MDINETAIYHFIYQFARDRVASLGRGGRGPEKREGGSCALDSSISAKLSFSCQKAQENICFIRKSQRNFYHDFGSLSNRLSNLYTCKRIKTGRGQGYF